MFYIDKEDKTIHITRGDAAAFKFYRRGKTTGETYNFTAGDVVRFTVFQKKVADNVVLQKDFAVTEETESVAIVLTKEETKIGGVINKPVDYWYEIEVNPYTDPQTIIGYDEDGAKIFKLYPEGVRNADNDSITEEDIPVVDAELSLTSTRPVQNQAIARAITKIADDTGRQIQGLTDEMGSKVVTEIAKQFADRTEQINTIIADATAEFSGKVDEELEKAIERIGDTIFTNEGGTIYGDILLDAGGLNNVIKGNDALHLIGGNGAIINLLGTGTVLSLSEGGQFTFILPYNDMVFTGRIDTETVDINGNNPNARVVELVTDQSNDTVIRVQNSLHTGTLFASHWGCFGIWSEYRDDERGIEPKFLIARDRDGNLFMDGSDAKNGGTPYHSKNKPSGSYKGTGANATISIGGIGKVLYIWSDQGTCHVTDLGWAGITGTSANSGTASSSNTASFKDGKLTISISESTHERVKFFNKKNTTYYYQVL